MKPTSLLFTQCLQNDFVMPLGRYDLLPNRLHIGSAEALRLMGENPAEGPVARMLAWAYGQEPAALRIIHLLDRHSADDQHQTSHLRQFGNHCLEGSAGAGLAFTVPANSRNRAETICSPTLNDFQETPLEQLLQPFADRPLRAGIMGVWTEAKVYFLAYELSTRYPQLELAVCSALCASSSRSQHFAALDQLQRILGVRVCDSVGEFMEFLGGDAQPAMLPDLQAEFPALSILSGPPLAADDQLLLRYLFRHCRQVRGKILDGGFSGNVVLGTVSVDLKGHEEAAHVVKIGPRNAMGQERQSFERIEAVLGNSAPRISDFADLGERGAIRYRYASMGHGSVSTFQKQYQQGLPLDKVALILTTVFEEQLGRLYRAAERETCNLLDYYGFSSQWASNVRSRVEAVLGRPATEEQLSLAGGATFPNLCRFYEQFLDSQTSLRQDTAWFAFVHGDLNGANIILDSHENVWLIDFFHTDRGHVLKDLIKLENDLLYIFTPVADQETLRQCCLLSDQLLAIEDLAAPLPELDSRITLPQLARAWQTVAILRSFYPGLLHSDRSNFQWLVGAMRYAVHTLSFVESSLLQKQWALYTAAHCGSKIMQTLEGRTTLRLDSLDRRYTRPGRISITILPGRRDTLRDLDDDLAALQREQVTAVVCCVPQEELAVYGVGALLERYTAAGLSCYHLPIMDQKVCSQGEMAAAMDWIRSRVEANEHLLLHCVGGLGRSGMVAACWLRACGLNGQEALDEVRRVRGPRTVETALQEELVRNFQ